MISSSIFLFPLLNHFYLNPWVFSLLCFSPPSHWGAVSEWPRGVWLLAGVKPWHFAINLMLRENSNKLQPCLHCLHWPAAARQPAENVTPALVAPIPSDTAVLQLFYLSLSELRLVHARPSLLVISRRTFINDWKWRFFPARENQEWLHSGAFHACKLATKGDLCQGLQCVRCPCTTNNLKRESPAQGGCSEEKYFPHWKLLFLRKQSQ